MKIVYKGETDKRAFKDAISAAMPAILDSDPDTIYLDADLMNCVGMTGYAAKNPGRAINCGIAEANMAGIASGLAVAGFKPYIHTFGPFASRRCYDQIFISAGYAKNAITVIGSDPGVCAAYNGGTHMPFEDMALYTALPEATVMDMSDLPMLESVLKKTKEMTGVKYIRMPRKNPVKIYEDGSEFEIGKGVVLKDGADAVIVACGIMTAKALSAAEKLAEEGINAAVIDMFTVKPLDKELLVEYAKKTGAVITAENHNKYGGLYSAVCSALAESCPTPVEYVAVEDEFGAVGPQDALEGIYNLTDTHIVEKVRAAVKRK